MLLCADVQREECHGDERLFPLKLPALGLKATGFDGGGAKELFEAETKKKGAPRYEPSVTVDAASICRGLFCQCAVTPRCIFLSLWKHFCLRLTAGRTVEHPPPPPPWWVLCQNSIFLNVELKFVNLS